MNRKKVYIFSSKIDVLALKSIIESEFDIESFSDYDNFLHALLSKDPSVVAVIISFFNVFNSKDEININNLKEILDVPYIVTVPSHGPLMKRAMSKGAYSLITIPYIPSSVKSVLTTSVNKYELAKVKKENEELTMFDLWKMPVDEDFLKVSELVNKMSDDYRKAKNAVVNAASVVKNDIDDDIPF